MSELKAFLKLYWMEHKNEATQLEKWAGHMHNEIL